MSWNFTIVNKCYVIKKVGFHIKYLRKHFRAFRRKYIAVPVVGSNIDLKLRAWWQSAHIRNRAGSGHGNTKRPRCDSCRKNESSIASVWALMGLFMGGFSRPRRTDKPSDRSFHQREQTLRSRRRHSRLNMSIERDSHIRTLTHTYTRTIWRD